MQKIFFIISALVVMLIAACNNSNNSTKQQDLSKTNKDSTQNITGSDTDIITISPTFTNLNTKVSENIKAIVSHYLHIKNALASNNADEAANGAKAMSDVLVKVDETLFSTDQKKVYDKVQDDLKEHAEHISKKADDIAHQREHFSMMSEDIYDLTKAFGGGQTLYHDYCPMFNDGKGALWLSEIKEIKNPYYGKKMLQCGDVKEKIQ